jgi:hypothetical protein
VFWFQNQIVKYRRIRATRPRSGLLLGVTRLEFSALLPETTEVCALLKRSQFCRRMMQYVNGGSCLYFIAVWVDIHGKGNVQYTRHLSIRGPNKKTRAEN